MGSHSSSAIRFSLRQCGQTTYIRRKTTPCIYLCFPNTFSNQDWNKLPYIVAVIKENLRWRPNMTASGTPRALSEDDTYGGYVFEKGTVFSYNHYAIVHNELEFPQNQVFKPERYLDDDLQDLLKGHLAFGLGKSFTLQSPERQSCQSNLTQCFHYSNRQTYLSRLVRGHEKHVYRVLEAALLFQLL